MSGSSNPEAPVPAQRAIYRATIERILNHNADTRSFFLRLEDGADFSFTPGQFISLELPVGGERIIRPYSIASNPEDGQPVEICLNLVPNGAGSAYLFSLSVGDNVSFTGPFGKFTLERVPALETVFIAETTAIAPIRPMIRRALAVGGHPPITLHHAAPDADALLYRTEFEAMTVRDSRFAFEPLIAQSDSNGVQLFEFVRSRYVNADQNRGRQFYVCGVGKPVFDLRDLLRGAGYERRAVQYERW